MRRLLCFVAALQLCAAALFGSFTPEVETGIFTNMNYWLGQANGGNGPQQAVRVLELGWAAPDPKTGHVGIVDQIRSTWGWDGAVPVATWMPYGYKTWKSPTPNADIVAGEYDDYIDAFLSQLSSKYVFETATPKRLFLRFAPAPNGNWFPWSPFCASCNSQQINQTADSYIAMWRYVIEKVRDKKYNLTKDVLQVVFDVGAFSASGPISSFMPPDSTVDWFSITGINWGNTMPGNSWVTPAQVFDDALQSLQAINATKPLALMSAGSTSSPNGVAAKSAWIDQLCQYSTSNNFKLLSYHNADTYTPQLADVAVFGGAVGPYQFPSPVSNLTFPAYPEFRDCVANVANFVGADTSNPRYITEKAFYGL